MDMLHREPYIRAERPNPNPLAITALGIWDCRLSLAFIWKIQVWQKIAQGLP